MRSVHFLIFFFVTVQSANILFLPMGHNPSHRRSMYPLAEALAERGHKVTVFCEMGFDDKVRAGKGVIDRHAYIRIDDPMFKEMFLYHNSTMLGNMTWNRQIDQPFHMFFPWQSGVKMCSMLLEQIPQEFQAVIAEKWNLIVIDGIFTICGMALLDQRPRTPYIIFNPSMTTSTECVSRGVPFPPSYLPPIMSRPNYQHTNFFSRLHSGYSYVVDYLVSIGISAYARHYISNRLASAVSLPKFYFNTQLSFTDYPQTIEWARPITPDMFPIGGHCKSARLDDAEMLKFVEDPTSKGTIIFAFGHMIQWNTAPPHVLKNILLALRPLKKDYRVVFQLNGVLPTEFQTDPNLAHVKFSKWLPQVALLNHPKTKLFVSHGGMKSIMESVCGGVPIIVMALFAEQIRNADGVIRSGAGLQVSKFEFHSPTAISLAMNTILGNSSKYAEATLKLKSFTVDRVRSPMQTAVFWTEYVIRRGSVNSKFWKHRGRYLSWYVYFNFDVISLLISASMSVIAVVIYAGMKLYPFVAGKKCC